MFLVELNLEGHVKDDITNDGWKAIADFRNLVEKHGIKGLTYVALVTDYLSPYKNYSTKDRPIRVSEEIFGNRTAVKADDELYKKAITKYSELQFHADLQQERIFEDMKFSILDRIQDANDQNDYTALNRETLQLQKHEEAIQKFKQRFDKASAIAASYASNGYELSRIENDLKHRKNSKFKNNGKGLVNPNKLHLEEQ